MSKTKELSIDSTLWVDALKIVDFKDVVLSKLNVKSREYNGGGFWFAISDLKGYFSFNNGTDYLDFYSRAMSKKQCTIKCGKRLFMLLDVAD